MDLIKIQEVLDSEELTTVYEAATEQIPIDRLLVKLPLENSEQELQLEILFIPGLEEELEGKRLLQFFVYLPIEIQEPMLNELKTAILDLNRNLPLMAFGLQTETQFVYFRHVRMLGEALDSRDLEVIAEVVWMIYFLVESNYQTLELTAAGKIQ